MAQSGFTPIKLYLSTTAAATPTAANLEPGELALNNNDGKLFYEDSSGVVQVIATKAGASGDVVGPASATANAIPSFDGTTGKLIKDNSGATISAGVITATGVSTGQVDITAQGDLRLQDTTGGQYVALQAPGTIATSYTLTLPVDDGTAGQALITDGSGVLSWSSAASGDVYGPASATDNAVARYDGTTGKIIQNSAVTIGDDGATVIAANSSSDGLRITQIGAGNALVVEDSANPDATPFVVNASGQVSAGFASNPATMFGSTPQLGVHTTGNDGLANYRGGNDVNGAGFIFQKTRGANPGVNTVVQSGDNLGVVYWTGADGTGYIRGAEIAGQVDGTPGTNDMPGRLVFSTTADGASSPTERMRIDAAGNVGVGTTSQAFEKLVLAGTFPSGSANTRANVVRGTIPSSTTSLFNGFRTEPATQAASFTLAAMTHFSANQGTLGAGSAVTNQYGFIAESSLTGATNNYGFLGNIVAGTGRWNFYAAGTATNYFEGNVAIGNAGFTSGKLNVSGGTIEFDPGSGADSTRAFNFNIGATNFGKILIPSGSGGAMAFSAGSTVVERIRIGSTGTISLGAAPGAESLRVTPVASAVNYVQVAGNIAGSGVTISSQGSDTNINFAFVSKGTGAHTFYSSAGNLLFAITPTASAVNYLQVTGGATGNAATFSAQGSDTNIDLALTPKGTGRVRFGTLTANADAPITGYIEVKDSAGNVRKLAVIA